MRLKLMPCAFCGSNRVRFYRCHDDRGLYVAVSCDRCMAKGPALRGPIGCDDIVTEDMRKEAVAAWNDIWHQIPAPPKAAVVFESAPPADRRVRQIQRQRRAAKASNVTAHVSPAPGTCAGAHLAEAVPGTANGHSGQVYPVAQRTAP